MKKTAIAYLAGLIDGEGCIDIYKTKQKPQDIDMNIMVCGLEFV